MVILYAAAIFLSAFLLFIVQPMIGKKILPWFGGGPSVWTTCMLFFQMALLGGYAYAHYIGTRLPARRQVAVHLAVVAVALLFLPVYPGEWLRPEDARFPAARILLLLALTVGVPYFVLSTTSPLLQKWFSQTLPGRSPYPLYALSNAGSLLGLVLFPALIEPTLPTRAQSVLWSVAFAVFALLLGLCAYRVWRSPAAAGPADVAPVPVSASDDPTPDAYTRFLWLLLAALGSMLLLGITNALCQDIAVVPFLWVLPLGLYLLTFIILFENDRWYYRPLFWAAGAVGVAATMRIMMSVANFSIPLQATVYLGTLFALCMICHGELVRQKPSPRHLTGFYLYISLGGALGALFVTLVAPVIFNIYAELHLALWGAPAAGLAAWWHEWQRHRPEEPFRARLLRFSPGLAALVILGAGLLWQVRGMAFACLDVSRNFYGVLRVRDVNVSDTEKAHRELTHGSTIHGWQMLRPDLSPLPTSYYHEESGISRAFRAYPRPEPDPARVCCPAGIRVGVVGLGIGTLAAFAHRGDYFRFYEIDPEVEVMARKYFTYLRNTPARCDIVLGDGRLSLEREEPQEFDLLILDAFTSDAVPAHLLTREAFQLYLRHLKPGGVIAVNIANRHLDLRPVLWAHADRFDLRTLVMLTPRTGRRWAPTHWVLLSANAGFFAHKEFKDYTPPFSPWRVLWTDDFNDLFILLKWHGTHHFPQWFAGRAKPITIDIPAPAASGTTTTTLPPAAPSTTMATPEKP
jgi:SAM-dependent methyltransferase